MAMTILDLALSHQTLNDPTTVEKFGSLKHDMFAQELFSQGADLNPDENDAKQIVSWGDYTMSRKPAPFTGARSPAVAEEGMDEQVNTSPCADIRVASQPFPVDMLSSRAAVQNWLAAQIRNLRKRIAISKELFAWQALKGTVALNSTTVPGSKVSIAWSQATTTLTPAAAWSTAATKIISSELPAFAQTYHDACGSQIRRFLIDREVKKYIRQNTETLAFVSNDPNPKGRLLAMETVMGPGFSGFELDEYKFDVHSTKYDKSGTLTKYLGDNQLIALPSDDELGMVLGRAEGYGAIPREAIGVDPLSMGGRAPNRGFYMYAYTTPNPAAVILVLGWKGLFVLVHPEAVGYSSDVTST